MMNSFYTRANLGMTEVSSDNASTAKERNSHINKEYVKAENSVDREDELYEIQAKNRMHLYSLYSLMRIRQIVNVKIFS